MSKRFFKDESGASSIEYGLVAALVSVIAIVALMAMGNAPRESFDHVEGSLADSTPVNKY